MASAVALTCAHSLSLSRLLPGRWATRRRAAVVVVQVEEEAIV